MELTAQPGDEVTVRTRMALTVRDDHGGDGVPGEPPSIGTSGTPPDRQIGVG
jgi:hypothetical protein